MLNTLANKADFIFSLGGFIFLFALLPSITGENKPEIATSLSTGIILYLFSATYFALKLKITTLVTFATGTGWIILAIQEGF